jgi:hypothetical protein
MYSMSDAEFIARFGGMSTPADLCSSGGNATPAEIARRYPPSSDAPRPIGGVSARRLSAIAG